MNKNGETRYIPTSFYCGHFGRGDKVACRQMFFDTLYINDMP
jgi:hypothetical protein